MFTENYNITYRANTFMIILLDSFYREICELFIP